MKFHIQQGVRAMILLAFSAMIFKLHYTGDINKFINPKYSGLSQTASIVFLILFFIQVTRVWTKKKTGHHCQHEGHSCGHDHGDAQFNTKKLFSYILITLPLLTGFLLPPKVLDASIASKKGAIGILSNKEESSQGASRPPLQNSLNESNIDENPEDPGLIDNQVEMSAAEYDKLIKNLEKTSVINMSDSVYSVYYDEINQNIQQYIGRTISVTGFVYKEKDFNHNQLVISRFMITHCVADASIVGFLSEFPKDPGIKEDTWIKVNGTLDTMTYNGAEVPYLKITEWEQIAEPVNPYLYPISIKIL
ncbi:putative membrane protein [Bacillus ectoiniformans]|uniref:TIGR03943 family putative permease subunit n=1 Tax=Bacillus ectoiniformans TaxID=1494429 RepID=UPI0019580A9D|nr:TIGR03943 family protein [Bacillus ectoiniformans]MBM7649898.1 putative membrane protein [Bacillus ectoiniformans]